MYPGSVPRGGRPGYPWNEAVVLREVRVLLALLCSVALGGSQLVLTSDRPMVVYVNMAPYALKGGSHKIDVDLPDGKEGIQRVAVRNVLQELVWNGEVDVPEGHKVVFSYLNRRVMIGDPERIGRSKLSERGLYNVDGDWVRDKANQNPLDVKPKEEPVGPAQPGEDVFLGAVEEAGNTTGAGGQHTEAEVILRPQAGQGEGVLRLHNRTTSWANLVVDGSDIEFRGERDKELTLGSGPHSFEMRDLRQELVWHGTVWVWPAETVELHFSASAEPAVPDRTEAWEGKASPEAAQP